MNGNGDLFGGAGALSWADLAPGGGPQGSAAREALGPAATVLRGWALPAVADLVAAVEGVAAASPFRHLITPGGASMSVAITNCGRLGWTSDRRGYRYSELDPAHGRPWPAMPEALAQWAHAAAAEAGFADFHPDACLVNHYAPGARMGLHQDRDERDLTQAIVSVSLGMPAIFLFGGLRRQDPVQRVPLLHGDVVVWGGDDRLRFHGVQAVKEQPHPELGARRLNLTFRRAG